MYLVSLCLAGFNCRYDGKSKGNEGIIELINQGKAIVLCPEQLSGLCTPRLPCEIIIDERGNRKVVRQDGKDLTKEFIEGGNRVLSIAKAMGIKKAILKSKSPSCGCGLIYDGTFSGKIVPGNGITAEILIKNGIEVYTEKDIHKLSGKF